MGKMCDSWQCMRSHMCDTVMSTFLHASRATCMPMSIIIVISVCNPVLFSLANRFSNGKLLLFFEESIGKLLELVSFTCFAKTKNEFPSSWAMARPAARSFHNFGLCSYRTKPSPSALCSLPFDLRPGSNEQTRDLSQKKKTQARDGEWRRRRGSWWRRRSEWKGGGARIQ
jgi:hypothetical protein